MKITKKLTPYNFTNKDDTNRIRYIVIHYFGSLATAANLAAYWERQYVGASAHYAVGHDGGVYQCVEDADIAWHCGANSYKHPDCRNTNSIGIEMAVCKKSTATLLASDKDWYFDPKTVSATVELVKELMQTYKIPIQNVLRHYDVTGKTCPNPYVFNQTDHTWDSFLKDLQSDDSSTDTDTEDKPEDTVNSYTKIDGVPMASAEQMAAYLISKNQKAESYAKEHAELYLQEGSIEGIRGDIAFAQRCIETGNDTFAGSAVTPDQHNYGGLGVTQNGMKGESYPNAEIGIRVHIQHLKAYANADALKSNCVDTRFKYVKRGCAPYVEHLGIQENPQKLGWAAGVGYGKKILLVLAQILKMKPEKPEEGKPTYYRIRSQWERPESQLHALTNLERAIAACPVGYKVFDEMGQVVYNPLAGGGVVPYEITIHNCQALAIRPEPNTNKPAVGYIRDIKRYTIVAEVDGWGKLKSGAGWIKLSYTKRA